MKRDFTYETQQAILKYADDVEKGVSWKSIGDGILDIYYGLKIFFNGGAKAAESKAEWERYYASVIEVRDYSVKKINKIFEGARKADHEFAVRAGNRAAEGAYLLTELKKITDIAQNRSLERIGTLAPLITSLKMSDEELIEWFQGGSSTETGYRRAVVYSAEGLLSMGISTAVLISVFHYKDIIGTNVFDTPSGNTILNEFKEDIFKGTCPFFTIKDVAQSLGITEKEARSLLGNVRHGRFRAYDYESLNNKLSNEALYQQKLDRLLKKKLDEIFSDEKQFEEFCKRYANDYTAETTSAILNSEVEGYTVSLYQNIIMNTLETCAEKQDVAVYPDKMEDYIKFYELFYKVNYKDGVDLSGAEIDETIRKFLKKELGYSVVTDEDIELCKISTEFMETLDGISKVGNYTQNSVDLLSYMLADYTNEIKLLDSLGEAGEGSPEFQIAMKNIREVYTNKAATIAGGVLKEGFASGTEMVLGKVTETVLPSMKIVDLGITVFGAGTGLNGYTASAQEVLGYSLVCPEMVDMYEEAVKSAAESGYDQSSMINVRNTFSMMKQSMLSYYDAQIEYTEGYLGGLAGADKHYQSYIKFEKEKLESLQLGQKYEPISYEEYKKRYGLG